MKFDYIAEKGRRIEQFRQALAPMHKRTVKDVQDCCFLVIEERLVDQWTAPHLLASRVTVAVPATRMIDSFEVSTSSDPEIEGHLEEGFRTNDISRRFIQIIFLEHHFELDLPRPMLSAHEARLLIQRQSGFHFLGDRGDCTKLAGIIQRFRPLRKAYVHGDNLSAALDIAHIFFSLWHFPVDSRLFLSTFGERFCWETGKPLE